MKYMSRPKSTAVMDIDVHIADILGKKYRYPIDSDKGDIHPPLLYTANGARNGDDVHHH